MPAAVVVVNCCRSYTPHESEVPCYLRGLTAERILDRCAEELRPHVRSLDAESSGSPGLEVKIYQGFPPEDLVSCEAADFVRDGRRFDVIFCSWTLFHLADPLGTLMQLRQVLAPEGVLLVNGAYIHFEHPKHDLEDQNTMDLFGLFCQQLAEHGLQCSVDGGPVQWIATSEDDGEYQGGYDISLRWQGNGESWREVEEAVMKICRFSGKVLDKVWYLTSGPQYQVASYHLIC